MPAAASPPPPAGPVFEGSQTLSSARSLTAEFLGDLTVTGRLIDCDLAVRRSLRGAGGGVCGGKIRASGDVTLGTLGDPQGVPTELVLGVEPPVPADLAHARRVLAEQQTAIQTMKQQIELLESNPEALDHAKREEVTLAMFDLPDLEGAAGKLAAVTDRANEKFGRDRGVDGTLLTIKTAVYPGVTLRVDGSPLTWTCSVEVPGPVGISIDAEGNLIAESDHQGRQVLCEAA